MSRWSNSREVWNSGLGDVYMKWKKQQGDLNQERKQCVRGRLGGSDDTGDE